MKKYMLVLLIIGFFSVNMVAQKMSQYGNRVLYGVKIGANIPRLYYTNKYLKELPHDFMIGQSLGVFVELPLYRFISFAAEINYQKRGGATSYTYEHDYHVSYDLQTYYASLRVPFYFYYPIRRILKSYILIGPDAGYAFSGSISLSQPGLDISECSININKSNYNPFYFGILIGVGMRHNLSLTNYTCVIKYDVAINWGFTDTFSQSEQKETATPTNVHAYNHQGERCSRGMELSISIGIIKNEDMGACRGFY